MIMFTALYLHVLPIARIYLDPGSGSILIQLLIAAVAGIGIFFSISWRRIKRLLIKKKGIEENPSDEGEEDDD